MSQVVNRKRQIEECTICHYRVWQKVTSYHHQVLLDKADTIVY
jgi:hypothetical protein